MYCSKCGKLNKAGAKFCTYCGSPLVQKTAQVSQTQKTYTGNVENKPCGAAKEAPKQENKKPAGNPNKSSALGIMALVFAFLLPINGMILGYFDYRTKDGYSKKLAKWAMIVAGGMLILSRIISVLDTFDSTVKGVSGILDFLSHLTF